MKRPNKSEYPPFYQTYIDKIPPRSSAKALLRQSFKTTQQLLDGLPESKGDYRYAEGKWSIKEMLIHLIDAERVFSYRILSFMRADRVALPGFNQDFWMEAVDVSKRSVKSLMKEWKAVRENTLFLLEQCTEEQSRFVGIASNWKVSVRSYFFIIIGHHYHHLEGLKRDYLAE